MRILTVEDDSDLAALIVAGLRKAGFAADAFATLDEARAAVGAVRYDAVILDLGLPDGDGMALLRELRAQGNDLPILILTARDGLDDRVAGFDAGGDDYLLKPFHMPELVARVKALLRRPNAALGVRLEAGNVLFDTAVRQVEVGGRPLALGRREGALLELLMRRSGRVVTKEAIEESLYDFADEVGVNAIEVQVHRLRRKLSTAGASVNVHTLRGVGYMLADAAA